MPEPLIGELIDIPDRVHEGDFVLNLAAGVTDENAAKTLADYVVTPQLSDCFDNALGFIKSALDARSSKAAYLHGSFGAGKSHFMAVLNLLLRGDKAARARPELQPVLARHAWAESKKFLLVPYHLIGARDLESAILGGYVTHVQSLHPTAPLPGVYVAEDIFANADQLRRQLGDEKFFAGLNRNLGADDGWGNLDQGWTAARFDNAVRARPTPDRKESDRQTGEEHVNNPRTLLVGALIQAFFPAYSKVAQAASEIYLPLDHGLSVLSRHAKVLGYDALILFLDELILWLASHAADVEFLHREGQKLAKLVESQSADRPVPVISFVARQRDLRELVGDTVTGARQVNFSDALKHWEGRFHTVTLEDRNLPLVAEKRVLRPLSKAAGDEIDRAFRTTIKMRQQARDVLMADADETAFRQVYPFSPALVQTLVAVSSALQRERTALKIMVQLLVERKHSLRLGELIPVGDLWDAVARGGKGFSDVVRKRFDEARKLYDQKLRPMLEEEYRQSGAGRGTPHAEAADGTRGPVAVSDDRLVKTLLLAALLPEVPALKNLTPDRLAALNHGSIRSLVPGREGNVVLNKLRQWAAAVGEVRLSDDTANPTVTLAVVDVDTEGIVEKARAFDSAGNRQRLVRDMVMQALGLPDPNAMWHAYPFVWRGTRRDVEVTFANIRDATEATFDGPRDGWRVVIDWPFDEPGHDRGDDLDRIRTLTRAGKDRRTLLWNPLFFSRKVQAEVGRLVILNQLLKEEMFQQYAGHLGLQDRATARGILDSQRNALTNTVRLAVEAAYGVRPAGENQLDAAHDGQETRFWSLSPLVAVQPPVGATLADALEHLAGQALAAEFPAHPNFDPDGKKRAVAAADLRKVYDVVQQAAQDPDDRAAVDRVLRPTVRQVVEPLRLGTMTETHFVLGDEWRSHLEKQRASAGLDNPRVDQLREWLDAPQKRGLPAEIGNLVILTYALQTNRSFYLHGPETPALDRLNGNLELRAQPLPTAEEWRLARDRAAELCGKAGVSDVLTATNVAQLDHDVREWAGQRSTPAARLPDRLQVAAARLHVADAELAQWPRYAAAVAGVQLIKSLLASAAPKALVQALARATADMPLSRSIEKAQDVIDRLGRVNWATFEGLDHVGDPRGRAVLDAILAALRDHEWTTPLAAAIDDAEQQAVRLLNELARAARSANGPPTVAPPADVAPVPLPVERGFRVVESRRDVTATAADFDALAAELRALLQPGNRRVRLSWVIEEEKAG